MKKIGNGALIFVVVLAIASAVFILVVRRVHESEDVIEDHSGAATVLAGSRTLEDTGAADFLSIFIYDGEGGVASFMVGGSTTEFSDFVEAVSNAEPAAGSQDESFTDLLVFSFEDQSTLEMAYSRRYNLIRYKNSLYAPSADLASMILSIEKRV